MTNQQGNPARRGNKPLLYTAQDVARYCEVDLKTIHHWADAAKIPHHRTDGRHLRFRHHHLVQFLRAHGYPLHDEITTARPTLFYACRGAVLASPSDRADDELEEIPLATDPLAHDEMVKKLGTRFQVRTFDSALVAIAHLVADEPDVLLVRADDPTWSGQPAIDALRASRETSWPVIAIVTSVPETLPTADDAERASDGPDLVLGLADVGRVHLELARILGLGPA